VVNYFPEDLENKAISAEVNELFNSYESLIYALNRNHSAIDAL
jgi:hypothetical protein